MKDEFDWLYGTEHYKPAVRRQPDVHDGDAGPVRVDGVEEARAVACDGGDIEPAAGQQQLEPAGEQDVVLVGRHERERRDRHGTGWPFDLLAFASEFVQALAVDAMADLLEAERA